MDVNEERDTVGERELNSSSLPGSAFRVMSFNIRIPVASDNIDQWKYRKEEVGRILASRAPALAGLQEVYLEQANDLERMLPEYDWYGPPREGGEKTGERGPIFHRTDIFECLDRGEFWLSETPEERGSKNWLAALPRVATWGKFRHISAGFEVLFINTHFDHWSWIARNRSAWLVIKRARRMADGAHVIVTGDLNSKEGSKTHRILDSEYNDARLVSERSPAGPEGTYRGFSLTSRVRGRIDYIFASKGLRVLDYEVIADTYGGGRRPSDHMPVTAAVMPL